MDEHSSYAYAIVLSFSINIVHIEKQQNQLHKSLYFLL